MKKLLYSVVLSGMVFAQASAMEQQQPSRLSETVRQLGEKKTSQITMALAGVLNTMIRPVDVQTPGAVRADVFVRQLVGNSIGRDLFSIIKDLLVEMSLTYIPNTNEFEADAIGANLRLIFSKFVSIDNISIDEFVVMFGINGRYVDTIALERETQDRINDLRAMRIAAQQEGNPSTDSGESVAQGAARAAGTAAMGRAQARRVAGEGARYELPEQLVNPSHTNNNNLQLVADRWGEYVAANPAGQRMTWSQFWMHIWGAPLRRANGSPFIPMLRTLRDNQRVRLNVSQSALDATQSDKDAHARESQAAMKNSEEDLFE